MSFKKVQKRKRILALVIGEANTGKSHLIADAPSPIIGIDTDGRLEEVAHLVDNEAIYSQENLADASDPEKILEWLNTNMPTKLGKTAKTIVWDSISPIVIPEINRAMKLAALTPAERKTVLGTSNKMACFQKKAMLLRDIRSIQKHGTHVIWVAHYEPGRDNAGLDGERVTIPQTELIRFSMYLTMRLRTILINGQYGVVIEYARKNPGWTTTLWDAPNNFFKGMWDRIMDAIYIHTDSDKYPTLFDFDHNNPLPNQEAALSLGIKHSIISPDGHEIWPFGNPDEPAAAAIALRSFKNLKEKVTGETTQNPKWKEEHPVLTERTHQFKVELTKAWQDKIIERIASTVIEEATSSTAPAGLNQADLEADLDQAGPEQTPSAALSGETNPDHLEQTLSATPTGLDQADPDQALSDAPTGQDQASLDQTSSDEPAGQDQASLGQTPYDKDS